MVAIRVINWKLITAVLAVCGIAVATYLTIIHYDKDAVEKESASQSTQKD